MLKWDHHLQMNGKVINKVDSTKFLGVHIDSRLTWNDHIFSLTSTIARNVGVISKLKYILPQPILKTLYQSLIVPHLSYCSIIWSGTSNKNLNRLFILQKRAIRHIAKADSHDHTSPLFRILNLLKLKDLLRVNVACFAHKVLNHILPPSFTDFFHRNNEVHSYSTRQANHIHQHPWRTNFGHLSLRTRAINVWNSLPLHFQRLQSTPLLKRKLIHQTIMEY